MAHLSAEIVLPDVTARHQFGNFREPRNALGGRNPAIKTAFFFYEQSACKRIVYSRSDAIIFYVLHFAGAILL